MTVSSGYSDPLYIQWNDTNIQITETLTVVKGKTITTQIPDDYQHVTITGYSEITEGTPTTGQYIVDYTIGIIIFSSDVTDGTQVNLSYFGKGVLYYPASRIYTHSTNPDVVETIQTMIDNYNNLNGVDLYTKFDPTSGHKHSGQAGDAPPIPASYIPISDTASIITATDVEGALQEIKQLTDSHESELSDQNAQTATLENGLSVITTDQATPTDVKFYGRTLVNLLGKIGNFDDTSPWHGYLGTVSKDSSSPKYGTNALKIQSDGTSNLGEAYIDLPFTLYANRYYLFMVEGKLLSGDHIAMHQPTSSNSFSNDYTTLYAKYTDTSDNSAYRLKLDVYSSQASGQVVSALFDGLRIYEIPQSIYDKIDVSSDYTGDALADKFPYVDSVQHVMNPYVKGYGKNLIPPFNDPSWTIHPNAKVISDYELELVTTASYQDSYIDIPVIPNINYTININHNGNMMIYGKTTSSWILNRSTLTSYSFNSGSNNLIEILIGDTGSSGTFTFTDPQLELGSAASPFEPQNESALYAYQDSNKNPLLLASNNDGSVADEVYERDGQWYRLSRYIKNLKMDGTLSWGFSSDYTGFKRVTQSSFNNMLSNDNSSFYMTKFDGLVISYWNGTFDKADKAYNYNNISSITISDTDSGWGETYPPAANEIKAYFYGWKMNNGTYGTAYTGATGDVKTWVPLGDTDNTRAVTVTPTSDAPTIAEGKIDHYKLTYQLANVTEEEIQTQGSFDLIDGGNQIELGEGVQITVNTDGTETITFLDDSNKYNQTSAINSLDVSYNTNIKTVVESLVQRLEDDETDIGILKAQMISVLARLQAGGL